ncbi:DUF433 domain-containing protein [Salinarimonas ramus]|nr:DUF433 domain-containing protein [Salinarimonas ramus]
MIQALSKSEAAYVAGLAPAVVDRAIDRVRFGRPYVEYGGRTRTVSPKGVFLIAADHLIAKDVAAAARSKLRRYLESELQRKPIEAMGVVIVPETAVPLRVDLSDIADAVSRRLRNLEAALEHIAEVDEVQAGAPTFRGTRVLVRPVAAALTRGVKRDELKTDYRLSDDQLDAALVYTEARPARGRPRSTAALQT